MRSSGPSFRRLLLGLVFSLLSTVKEHRWSSILLDWKRERRSKKESSSSFLEGDGAVAVVVCARTPRPRCFPSGVS